MHRNYSHILLAALGLVMLFSVSVLAAECPECADVPLKNDQRASCITGCKLETVLLELSDFDVWYATRFDIERRFGSEPCTPQIDEPEICSYTYIKHVDDAGKLIITHRYTFADRERLPVGFSHTIKSEDPYYVGKMAYPHMDRIAKQIHGEPHERETIRHFPKWLEKQNPDLENPQTAIKHILAGYVILRRTWRFQTVTVDLLINRDGGSIAINFFHTDSRYSRYYPRLTIN